MAASSNTPFDPQADRILAQRVLRSPELYPDEFKAWVPRFISANPNLQVAVQQLPKNESVHHVGDPGEPALTNGAIPSSPWLGPNFYKDVNGVVWLAGAVDGGAGLPRPCTIFTLPAGYRPAQQVAFVTAAADAGLAWGTPATVYVQTDGTVYFASGSNNFVSLGGIFFQAA